MTNKKTANARNLPRNKKLGQSKNSISRRHNRSICLSGPSYNSRGRSSARGPTARAMSDRFRRLRIETENTAQYDYFVQSSPNLVSPMFCPAAPSARPNFISFPTPSKIMVCSCDDSDMDCESNEYCPKCGNMRDRCNSFIEASEEELKYICMSPVWGVEL